MATQENDPIANPLPPHEQPGPIWPGHQTPQAEPGDGEAQATAATPKKATRSSAAK
jgi:hypothetical protein